MTAPHPFIAHRLATIKPSPTLALTQKAAELRALGKDILSLTAGEPDFDTPPWVCEAATKAMAAGQTKYTAVAGTPELRQAIVTKFAQDNHVDYTPNEIIVGTGGKQIIFNAILATVNRGDEVIIPDPYWVSYPDIVEIAEGTQVFLSCAQSQGFKVTPEQLEKAITPKTKWFILNSPSNPTGAMYSYDELWQLAQVLRRHPHVLIMSDDIYEHITFDGNKFHALADIEKELKDRTLMLNGVSKSYSMTGWRIGYAGGPLWLIKAMSVLQSQSTSNACSISQAAALAALEGPQDFLKQWVQEFQDRRDFVVAGLNEIDGLQCLVPHGTFYAYPSCADYMGATTPHGDHIESDEDFCAYLLDEAGVATVPGSAFGRSPHFRISYATDRNTLEKSLERLKIALGKLTKMS
ncbi:MAG: pyridoxal phosphate-dependent aminotransferase [Alphaproteobacteria bacterium]|nr:pyridoxal phosphate-dependent aminotransferase [Alphaproteobacteria bacterium]